MITKNARHDIKVKFQETANRITQEDFESFIHSLYQLYHAISGVWQMVERVEFKYANKENIIDALYEGRCSIETALQEIILDFSTVFDCHTTEQTLKKWNEFTKKLSMEIEMTGEIQESNNNETRSKR